MILKLILLFLLSLSSAIIDQFLAGSAINLSLSLIIIILAAIMKMKSRWWLVIFCGLILDLIFSSWPVNLMTFSLIMFFYEVMRGNFSINNPAVRIGLILSGSLFFLIFSYAISYFLAFVNQGAYSHYTFDLSSGWIISFTITNGLLIYLIASLIKSKRKQLIYEES